MPCYVIAQTRFRLMKDFHIFRSRLEILAADAHLRVLPLRESQTETEDQAVMMEFETAECARAFMCSDRYRRIARSEAAPEA